MDARGLPSPQQYQGRRAVNDPARRRLRRQASTGRGWGARRALDPPVPGRLPRSHVASEILVTEVPFVASLLMLPKAFEWEHLYWRARNRLAQPIKQCVDIAQQPRWVVGGVVVVTLQLLPLLLTKQAVTPK